MSCRHWWFDAWFWLGPSDAYCIGCWIPMQDAFEDDLTPDWREIAEAINASPEGKA